jgi:hypothetical protein
MSETADYLSFLPVVDSENLDPQIIQIPKIITQSTWIEIISDAN